LFGSFLWTALAIPGIVFALTKRMLPNFRPIFEAFASDLRCKAEDSASEDF